MIFEAINSYDDFKSLLANWLTLFSNSRPLNVINTGVSLKPLCFLQYYDTVLSASTRDSEIMLIANNMYMIRVRMSPDQDREAYNTERGKYLKSL